MTASWFEQMQATPWWRALVAQRGQAGALEELRRQANAVQWDELRARARADVNVFIPLVFRNDQDPDAPPFVQQWFHREWQSLWNNHAVTVLHGATGFGKSEQYIGRLLWRLGNNPKLRITVLGKQQQNASKTLLKVKRQIEDNPIVRQIFPELKPGSPWSSEKLRLATAGTDITTNNVEVYGLDGSPQGLRGDEILADDVLDFRNTRTEGERNKTIEFFDTAIQSRGTTYSQLNLLANAWHPKDLAFTYSRRQGIVYGCYPAENPVTGELLWPSFRSREWLAQKKAQMSPSAYARMFLCQPTSDEARLFEKDWFALARRLGVGLKPVRSLPRESIVADPTTLHLVYAQATQRMRIVVGVDLATGRKSKRRKSDFTSFFVVALLPSGARQVLWAETVRLTAPAILKKLVEYEARYKPDRFVVESNAAQIFLSQFASELEGFTTPIDDFETSDLKWDESLGIEEIGIEMKAQRWLLPGPAAGEHPDAYLARLTPEERDAYAAIQQAAEHLLDFTRGPHTPDDVMAWYFAKEGIKRLLTGVFSHRHARPEEQAAREEAGAAGTVRALFGEGAAAAEPPGLAVPSPYDPSPDLPSPAAPSLPDHVRSLLGLR